MSNTSTIEWTDATWNPVTGCTEVSPGCDHCYARTFAERFRGTPGHPYEQGFDLKLWPERLDLPQKWKKPRRIFTNSMSDLFHKDVPDVFIGQVFNAMAKANQHIYQVLTKRPSRLLTRHTSGGMTLVEFLLTGMRINVGVTSWPAHIWLGVSVENEDYTWRIDKLRQVPAPIRFLSCEPLLGPLPSLNLDGISWVITGGESGSGARPCHPDWVRAIRDQCVDAGVAYFHKQWGGHTSKSGGRLLDGKIWNEFPR